MDKYSETLWAGDPVYAGCPTCEAAGGPDHGRLILAEGADLSDPIQIAYSFACNHGHYWTEARTLPRSRQPRAPRPARRCALYWHFDGGGTLLYIGISEALVARGEAHADRSDWVKYAVSAKAQWFPSRDEAEQEERQAIAQDVPIFNIAHAIGDPHQRIADYLDAHPTP